MSLRNILALATLAMVGASFTACGKSETGAAPQAAAESHTHEGWWCDEHGVPEEICALCDTSLVADFKSKGDWCEEHNRPESQCFICHPEKEAEFAALYEAKYGEQPPKATAYSADASAESGGHVHQ